MHFRRKPGEEAIPFELPVHRDTIFSDYRQIYRKKIERRQRSLLKRLSFLGPFLEQGEEIYLITTGCSPVSSVERFWTGLNVFELKCSMLIFTDRRVFHIPATRHYAYRNSIAHFYYADCVSLRVKGLTLIVVYKNGIKEKFHYIAVSEERKLKSLMKSITTAAGVDNARGRIHLCPRCAGELKERVFVCLHCGLPFKDITTARRIAVFLPGGGYFYTRHPWLGLGDVAAEMILLGLTVISVLCHMRGVGCSLWGMVIFPLVLVFEKMLTVYHSGTLIKEYIPKDKDIDITGQ